MQKNNYRVADGVTAVNGQPVPESRQIALSPAEALFDLAHGYIVAEAAVLALAPHFDPVADPIVAPVTRSGRGKDRS